MRHTEASWRRPGRPWHELLPDVKSILEEFDLQPARVHTHIGSGSDPAVWQKVSGMSLDLCREFPSVDTLNLGGGYKVGRMSYEKSTDLAVVKKAAALSIETTSANLGKLQDGLTKVKDEILHAAGVLGEEVHKAFHAKMAPFASVGRRTQASASRCVSVAAAACPRH